MIDTRKDVHGINDKIDTITENIRVICRLRPQINDQKRETSTTKNAFSNNVFITPDFNKNENDTLEDNDTQGSNCFSKFAPDGTITYCREHGSTQRSIKVDACIGPDVSQEYLYRHHINDIVGGVQKGYNGTIITYGQTGSGKTFTLRGTQPLNSNVPYDNGTKSTSETICDDSKNNVGVVNLALQQLFMDHNEGKNENIYVSYFQMYCEVLQDLLANPKTIENEYSELDGLSIREKNGHPFVENLSTIQVSTYEDAIQILERGDENMEDRISHLKRDQKSRSHTVIAIMLIQDLENTIISKNQCKRTQKSYLTFVDLAGSERVKKSGVTYQKFEELKAVNLSLSALKNCIAALSSADRNHVPYRDSKLTRILQPCLTGTSRTVLIVCLCPGTDDAKESLSSLLFAQRATKVKINAARNDYIDYEALYNNLQKKEDSYCEKIHYLSLKNTEFEENLQQSKETEREYEDQIKKLLQQIKNYELQSLMSKIDDENTALDGIKTLKAANAKWNDEIFRLQNEQEEEMREMKRRYEQNLSAYKEAATAASEREYELENTLNEEKEQHLALLQKVRLLSNDLREIKSSSSKRINELLTQVNELRDRAEEATANLIEDQTNLKCNLIQMETRQNSKPIINRNETEPNVSQDILLKMEKVFTETVKNLMDRIKILEQSQVAMRNQDKRTQRKQLTSQSKKILEKMEASVYTSNYAPKKMRATSNWRINNHKSRYT